MGCVFRVDASRDRFPVKPMRELSTLRVNSVDHSLPKVDADPGPTMVSAEDATLFVDLDGTLIATDLLWESLLLVVRDHPQAILKIPFWLMSGRARLKRNIAALVAPDANRLPYRSAVLEFLQAQRAQGRRMVLATASDQWVAGKIADHLGLFDDRICTNGGENLKGTAKLAAIETYCQQRGSVNLPTSAIRRPTCPSGKLPTKYTSSHQAEP